LVSFTNIILYTVGVILVFILINALRKPILFKMGLRNMARRRGMTTLVISGLMIGTVIITSALIVGDTMENLVTWEVRYGYYEVDQTIEGRDTDGRMTDINESLFEELREEILKIDNVEHVAGLVGGYASVNNTDRDIQSPSIRFYGVSPEDVEDFGGFEKDGEEYVMDLDRGEVLMDERAADIVEAQAGDHLTMYVNTHEFDVVVKDIIDYENLGRVNLGQNIIMNRNEAQEMVFGFYVTRNRTVTPQLYFDQGFDRCTIENGTFFGVLVRESDVKDGMFASSRLEGSIMEGGVVVGPDHRLDAANWSIAGPGMDIRGGVFQNVLVYNSTVSGGIFNDTVFVNCQIEQPPVDTMALSDPMNITNPMVSGGPLFSNVTMMDCTIDGGMHMAGTEQPNAYINCTVDNGMFVGAAFKGGSLNNGSFPLAVFQDTYVNPLLFTNPTNAILDADDPPMPLPFNVTVTAGSTELKILYGLLEDDNWEARQAEDPTNVNFIIISNDGDFIEGEKHCKKVAADLRELLDDPESQARYNQMTVSGVKSEDIESNREQMSFLTNMFLILGTFSIIAGVVLIVNIFILLSEERKSEMGMARAVGMLRSHLRQMFIFEGTFYATLASFVGVLVGILSAYGVIFIFERIIGSFGEDFKIMSYFTFTTQTVVFSFATGFLLTIGTVIVTTTRISKLNIVRAVRSIPEPPIPTKDRKALIMGILVLLLGILIMMGGISQEQITLAMVGSSLAILGGGMVARRWTGDRIAFTITGLFLIFWWLSTIIGIDVFPYEAPADDMSLFITSGLFLVTASTMVVMFNSNVLISFLNLLVGRGRSTQAVLKIGMSYPMKHRFRTALTMFIFALIMFTIVVMSMIVHLFNENLDPFIESQAGNFDIIGFSGQDLGDTDEFFRIVEETPNITAGDIERVQMLAQAPVTINYTYEDVEGNPLVRNESYSIISIDDEFLDSTTYSFQEYFEEEYDSADDVWESLSNTSRVVLDGSVMYSEFHDPGMSGWITFEPGDTIVLTTPDGTKYEKLVVGILDETFLNGVFLNEKEAAGTFNVTSTNILLIDLDEDVDSVQWSKDIQGAYTRYGLMVIPMDQIMEQIQSGMNQIFNLFIAFLGLGLVIGIAGLGIVTIRAIHERRREIGMIRAIGFKQRMVSSAFLTEALFITIIGIGIGITMGILIGVLIWQDGFKDMGFDFVVPWTRIVFITAITLAAAFLCTVVPARKASKVAPAEALRFD